MKTPLRRALALLSGSLLLAFPLAGAAAAQTPAETGDYSGSADASVLDFAAADATEEFDNFTLLDASVAPTETAADTTDGLAVLDEDGLTAYGYGANLSGEIAGEGGGAGPVEVVQTAPPDNEEPESETLIEIPAAPLVEMKTFSGEALARDVGTVACPDDDVASFGWSQVDDTRLFPEGADGEDVAHLGGVVDTRSEVSLTDLEGQDPRGVQSQATASAASLDLFGGQDADALTIEIVSEPTLTAVAGGTPGSAEVTYEAPVVMINGEGFEADPGEEQRLTIPPDAEPGQEDLLVDIEFGRFSSETADDGTSAAGEASVLDITLLSAVEQGTLATISLAPMSVDATAPAGGVDCPAEPAAEPDDGLDVGVDGPDEVAPGDEFDTTIDVTNLDDCPVTDLVVVGEITGPEGAEIVATDPDATVDGLTATWDDLDDLAPDETMTFTATVSVPEDAEAGSSFRTDATATGTCDGEDVEGEGAFEGPTVADDTQVLSAVGEDDSTDDDEEPTGDDQPTGDDGASDASVRSGASGRLPETGGGLALAAVAALGMASVLHRRS